MPELKLPNFRKPPVVETVIGVQFDPIKGLTNAHLGAFWKTISEVSCAGERWTKVTDAVPLTPSHERFEPEHAWSRIGLMLQVSQEPPASRLQIGNESGDAMIQVQNGRLHYNWIRRPNNDYLRYGKVRPKFDAVLEAFTGFLRKEGFEGLKPNQWEVTYVTHIPKGSVWRSPADWAELFVGFPTPSPNPGDVQLESFAGAWHYVIPERRGRLHVDAKHARTQDEAQMEVLRLTLTARGPVAATSTEGGCRLSDGLDLGRRVIVEAFSEMFSAEALAYWELER